MILAAILNIQQANNNGNGKVVPTVVDLSKKLQIRLVILIASNHKNAMLECKCKCQF